MINLDDERSVRWALDYYQQNVGAESSLEIALLAWLSKARHVAASFAFESPEQIQHGSRNNRLIADLQEVFGSSMGAGNTLYVFDVWTRLGDSAGLVIPEFSPSTVYEVGTLGEINADTVRAAFSRCMSFVTVWFAANRCFQPATVAISAFDQEGCIAWL